MQKKSVEIDAEPAPEIWLEDSVEDGDGANSVSSVTMVITLVGLPPRNHLSSILFVIVLAEEEMRPR